MTISLVLVRRLLGREVPSFRPRGGTLEIAGDDGEVVWSGRPDGLDVEKVLRIDGRSGAILLLDSDNVTDRRKNVVRVGGHGELVWRAELPSDDDVDAYVAARRHGDEIAATSWSGYRVLIDGTTGEITEREFVK